MLKKIFQSSNFVHQSIKMLLNCLFFIEGYTFFYFLPSHSVSFIHQTHEYKKKEKFFRVIEFISYEESLVSHCLINDAPQ